MPWDSSISGGQNSQGLALSLAAVLDVITNEEHEDYSNTGFNVGTIRFKYVGWGGHLDSADNSFYDTHFRLDGIGEDGQLDNTKNTQHFYEDIGKYNKYLFGWYDWFSIYGHYESDFSDYNFNWILQDDGQGNIWHGNQSPNDSLSYYLDEESKYESKNGIYSGMRAKYIQMRIDAEDEFKVSRTFSYGIIFNHILASIDAVRVTKKANIRYLSNNNSIKIRFVPQLTESGITPSIVIAKRFF